MDNIEVIKFGASWCVPCRIYTKTFDIVTAKMHVPSRHIDIEAEPDMKAQYGITRIPTTVILKNGTEATRHVGPMLNRDLVSMISEVEAKENV